MKITFNKYYIIIALCIIVNVLIFQVVSKKLESYVVDVKSERTLYDIDN